MGKSPRQQHKETVPGHHRASGTSTFIRTCWVVPRLRKDEAHSKKQCEKSNGMSHLQVRIRQ